MFRLSYFKYLTQNKAKKREEVKTAPQLVVPPATLDVKTAPLIAAASTTTAGATTSAAGGSEAASKLAPLSVEQVSGAADSSIKTSAAADNEKQRFSADEYDELEGQLSAQSMAALDGIQRYKSPFPALCDDVLWSLMKARVRSNVWAHDVPPEQRNAFASLAAGTTAAAPAPVKAGGAVVPDTRQKVLVVYPLISRFVRICFVCLDASVRVVKSTLSRVYVLVQNHSCAPNVALLPSPSLCTAAVVFTLEPIRAGTELCLSYDDNALLLSPEQRRATLRAEHDFECSCSRCAMRSAADQELEKIAQPTHRSETHIMERDFVLVEEVGFVRVVSVCSAYLFARVSKLLFSIVLVLYECAVGFCFWSERAAQHSRGAEPVAMASDLEYRLRTQPLAQCGRALTSVRNLCLAQTQLTCDRDSALQTAAHCFGYCVGAPQVTA